jgi:putative membrane protein
VNLDGRSVPYRVLENASRLVFVALFGVVSSTSSGGSFDPGPLLVIVALGTAAIVGWELAYVRRYTYELTEETFDIESGVLSRREREIPYERVQNVDISQNVVQRALDIAEVRLETAGGSGSEAALKYVSRAEADRLQEALSRRKRPSTDDGRDVAVDDKTLFVLSRRELGVLGLVSADLRLLGLATIGLSAVAPTLARRLTPTVDLVSLAGPSLALAGLAGLWVVSAVAAMSRYWSFRLDRGDEELRYERGLIQRYNGTIPLSKVQTLRLRENVLARMLGYANLVVETAGYGPGDDGGAQSAVPLAERDRALALARTLEPVGELSFTRPPKRARTRYAIRYGLAVGALVAVLGAIDAVTGALGPWYVAAGLFALVLPAAHLTWVNRGYDIDEDYVVTRSGFWRRETVVVPYDRVQTVENSQTVFQRRRSLGTLVVDTASSGGVFGTAAAAIDIDAGAAERLREAVVERFQAELRRRPVANPGD